MTRKVRKAVFPAAGLGTRFLPATKAMPKEMLPLVDKPLIQYGVEEPLAVILSDDIIDAETPCLRQLLDVYEFYSAPVLALMEVPRENISAYGVVDAEPVAHNGGRDRLYRIRNLVEKPKAADAPSNLAIIGRYVLTPEIFRSLETIEPGSGGEIQLTDGLKHMLRSRPIYGYKFEGKRYDAGDKQGFLQATVELALKRHDLGEDFRQYLKSLNLEKT